LQINIISEGHVSSVDFVNFKSVLLIQVADFYLSIEPTESNEAAIKLVGSLSGSDTDNLRIFSNAIHAAKNSRD
jgi:hypothetical protein